MSSLSKMLAILDLFGVESPIRSAEEISTDLGYSRPQGYRYIRELCRAGLLVRFSGSYALGPRAIEIDYIIRQGDPLLRAGEAVMRDIRDRHGCDVLLTSMVGDRVIAVHHERGDDPTTVNFGRGRVMPLFRGAGSKVIVATLSRARQERLFERHSVEMKDSTLGGDRDHARAALKGIKRAGFAVSLGELEPVNVGIAVPLRLEHAEAPSSLVLVVNQARYATSDLDALVRVAQLGARQILAGLADSVD